LNLVKIGIKPNFEELNGRKNKPIPGKMQAKQSPEASTSGLQRGFSNESDPLIRPSTSNIEPST
jgi:hypothetical protein